MNDILALKWMGKGAADAYRDMAGVLEQLCLENEDDMRDATAFDFAVNLSRRMRDSAASFSPSSNLIIGRED